MDSRNELIISANELEQLASGLDNPRICYKLDMAARTMRIAAAELEDANRAPPWLVPLQDSVYALCVSIIEAGWIVRTTVTPGAKTFNVHNFAIDSYERLIASLTSNTYAVTRASRQYPNTTRREDIRRELRKHESKRQDS
jgi:hypothetical protein